MFTVKPGEKKMLIIEKMQRLLIIISFLNVETCAKIGEM